MMPPANWRAAKVLVWCVKQQIHKDLEFSPKALGVL